MSVGCVPRDVHFARDPIFSGHRCVRFVTEFLMVSFWLWFQFPLFICTHACKCWRVFALVQNEPEIENGFFFFQASIFQFRKKHIFHNDRNSYDLSWILVQNAAVPAIVATMAIVETEEIFHLPNGWWDCSNAKTSAWFILSFLFYSFFLLLNHNTLKFQIFRRNAFSMQDYLSISSGFAILFVILIPFKIASLFFIRSNRRANLLFVLTFYCWCNELFAFPRAAKKKSTQNDLHLIDWNFTF